MKHGDEGCHCSLPTTTEWRWRLSISALSPHSTPPLAAAVPAQGAYRLPPQHQDGKLIGMDGSGDKQRGDLIEALSSPMHGLHCSLITRGGGTGRYALCPGPVLHASRLCTVIPIVQAVVAVLS